MDGTIVDNMRVHMRVWVDFLATLDIQITDQDYLHRASGKTNPQILSALVGDHLTDAEVADYAERKEALYRTVYGPYIRPLPGLTDFLDGSRRLGIPMALASAAPRVNIDFVLDRLGIASHFDVTIGVEEIRRGKPDPEIFLTAARRLGVSPGKCVVFEDSRVGIEAAGRAGMKAVAVATTVDPREFRSHPAVIHVVSNFAGLDPGSLVEGIDG